MIQTFLLSNLSRHQGSPNPHFSGLGGRYKVVLAQKFANLDYCAAAGNLQQKSLILPDIQYVETLNSLIFGLTLIIVREILLNSAFTRRAGFITYSSTSGKLF